MINESKVKLTIFLKDPDLDDEQLDKLTRNLRREIEEFGEEAYFARPQEIPENTRALEGVLLGVLNAEVSVTNLKKLLGFLGDRLSNKPIKLAIKKPDGTEFNIEAGSREELEFATQKILDLMKNA